MEIGNWKFSAGYTLVEMLIYMGLLSIIMVILLQLFTSLIDIQLDTRDSSVVEQDSKYILARLFYDIHRADSIASPGPLGTTTNTLQLAAGGTSYTYDIQNGNLYLVTSQSDQLNGVDTTISNLSFKRIGNTDGKHLILVTYTVTSKINTTTPEVKNVSTTIGMR